MKGSHTSSEGLAGLSRRDFLKYCAATAALLGLSDLMIPRIATALEAAARGKVPIVWLTAQGCKGCQVSLLNSDEPTPSQIILDSFSMRFFPLVMAGSGDLAISAITETMDRSAGQYVLLVEGAVPLAAGGKFDTMGFEQGKPVPIEVWVRRLAMNAKATIAIGTCAAYGGVPVLGPGESRDLEAILQEPIPAVPGCPPHPDWIVGTLTKLLLFGKTSLLADLDDERRPKEFYGEVVHDNCPRRAAFDAGIFVDNFNDNLRVDNACLLTKGCKGPLTHADCPLRRWNQRMNWCIGAGAPCNGCTEPAFYAGFSPLFDMLPTVKLPGARPAGISADALGETIGAATAIGIGAHLVARVATGKIGGRRPPPAEEEGPESAPPPAEEEGPESAPTAVAGAPESLTEPAPTSPPPGREAPRPASTSPPAAPQEKPGHPKSYRVVLHPEHFKDGQTERPASGEPRKERDE